MPGRDDGVPSVQMQIAVALGGVDPDVLAPLYDEREFLIGGDLISLFHIDYVLRVRCFAHACVGFQLSVVSCSLSVIRCQLPVVSCPLSVIRCQLPVVSCPLSVIRCQLPVVSCPLSVVRGPLQVAV